MKELSFGILMTDFLEAALREMASSVPVALLCQSSSRHTSQLPAAKPIGCDRHSWHNAADGGTVGCAGQREFHRQQRNLPSACLCSSGTETSQGQGDAGIVSRQV